MIAKRSVIFGTALVGYAAGIAVYRFSSFFVALAVLVAGGIVAVLIGSAAKRKNEAAPLPAETRPEAIGAGGRPDSRQSAPDAAGQRPGADAQSGAPGRSAADQSAAAGAQGASGGEARPAGGQAPEGQARPSDAHDIPDPELASAVEYMEVIQDMILLEGKKNNLDDEIVEKTSALLARLNRLIPDLVALGDPTINYNIVRLIRRDLNSTINPFLRLSGEAKRQNRRLLLDGIKDINSKLTFYTQTLEQKDLIELRTKAELIQQRYRLSD